MEASEQFPKAPPRYVLSLVGSRVIVNNGSLNKVSKPNGQQVFVTPLANTPSVRPLVGYRT